MSDEPAEAGDLLTRAVEVREALPGAGTQSSLHRSPHQPPLTVHHSTWNAFPRVAAHQPPATA
ncbi:hypothetical protein AB0D49_32930 [Streptomyces sp. NPDC048290]|uniref:hypothetical protein n=1 Tax=Streptomyces sp. NPDC048290 TaxID=3155811 RepID=UPI003440BC64